MALVAGHVLAEAVALSDPWVKSQIPSKQDWLPEGSITNCHQHSLSECAMVSAAQQTLCPTWGHPHAQLSILTDTVFLGGGEGSPLC